jgi:hypothetical protein
MDKEYTFRIDAFTPETLPAERFAEYVRHLARLLGEPANVHFKDLTEGSAKLAVCIDEQVRVKVRDRLSDVTAGNAVPEAMSALNELDKMLANDNAIGELYGDSGALILKFPGRTKPRPVVHGPIVQEGSVQGQLVRIGGQDSTSHATLQDGPLTVRNITMKRELAAQLAKYLYGETICLGGKGKYYRTEDGEWYMDGFAATSFEVLDDRCLSEIIDNLQAVNGSDWSKVADPLEELRALRGEDEVMH